MRIIWTTASLCFLVLVPSYALAQHESHGGHHGHEIHIYDPIGVMGAHPHEQGEWMFTYGYGAMNMEGNRDGTGDVSTAQVLEDFVVSPTEMTMQMHMFGLMYGLSDRLTIMGMVPYVLISMDHISRMGTRFTTDSEGVGDLKLSAIYTLHVQGSHQLLLNAGIGFPTGSIDERDDTPAGANQKLPYPMQLGSGTYDLIPGITYTEQRADWSWGSQIGGSIRLGDNDNDYRLGDEYRLTLWGVRKLRRNSNASLRIDGRTWGNIRGADPDLNPMVVPTSRTDLRGGDRIDLLVGIDLTASEGKLRGNRLAVEFGFPIYQHLDGPQLEMDYRLTVGWQWVF